MTGPKRDAWARWLLELRPPGPELAEFRDTVLDRAGVGEGDVVLDVGCGDGLIAFGALRRVGPGGRVVFSDISADTLAHCRAVAEGDDRCTFVQTGLPDLAGIGDETADVATLRSVLIYVKEKAESFRALHRVLRRGGRLSMFEPINVFDRMGARNTFLGYDVTGLDDLAAKVKDLYRGLNPAMVDFDERDLLTLAENAGFTDIRLDYRAEIGEQTTPIDWDVPPNPLAPSMAEAFERVLTPAERDALSARLVGPRRKRFAVAYLSARRP